MITTLLVLLYLVIGNLLALLTCYLDKKYKESMKIENIKYFTQCYIWCTFVWPIAMFFISYLLLRYYHFKVKCDDGSTNYQHIVNSYAYKKLHQ
jgi:hypothetical protein